MCGVAGKQERGKHCQGNRRGERIVPFGLVSKVYVVCNSSFVYSMDSKGRKMY